MSELIEYTVGFAVCMAALALIGRGTWALLEWWERR